PTSPPPNRDEGRPPPPPPSTCANAGIATKSAAKTHIHRFIRSPLEIESQSGFDLTRLACSARLGEVRGCHRTAESIQLHVVEQVRNLHLECHRRTAVVLVLIAAISTVVATTLP